MTPPPIDVAAMCRIFVIIDGETFASRMLLLARAQYFSGQSQQPLQNDLPLRMRDAPILPRVLRSHVSQKRGIPTCCICRSVCDRGKARKLWRDCVQNALSSNSLSRRTFSWSEGFDCGQDDISDVCQWKWPLCLRHVSAAYRAHRPLCVHSSRRASRRHS